MEIYEIIKKPHITEKSHHLMNQGKYVIEVDKSANKSMIKQALKKIYQVDVSDIKVINMPGRQKRRGRIIGRSPAYKKTIVTLKKGQKIEGFDTSRK